MQLPPELFTIIGLHADAATLRTVRLVSRLMSEMITPLAWRDIIIRPSGLDLMHGIQPYLHARPDANEYGENERVNSPLDMSYLKPYPRRCTIDITHIFSGDFNDDELYTFADELRMLVVFPHLNLLDVRLGGTSTMDVQCNIGRFITGVLSSLSTLPFQYLLVSDRNSPGLHVKCETGEGSLHMDGTVAPGCAQLPRWTYINTFQFTDLSLHCVVLSNDSIRGIYHMVPLLRRMSLSDCTIDMGADAVQTLRWASFWTHVRDNGSNLLSVHVDKCGYGRSEPPFGPLLPLEENLALYLLLKDDALAGMELSNAVTKRMRSAHPA